MAVSKSVAPDDVFQDLDVDQLDVNVVESLCLNCGENVSEYYCRIKVLFNGSNIYFFIGTVWVNIVYDVFWVFTFLKYVILDVDNSALWK